MKLSKKEFEKDIKEVLSKYEFNVNNLKSLVIEIKQTDFPRVELTYGARLSNEDIGKEIDRDLKEIDDFLKNGDKDLE